MIQLTVTQTDVEQALTAYLGNIIKLADGVKLDFDFRITRGDAGLTVEASILNQQDQLKSAKAATSTTVTKTEPTTTEEPVSVEEVIEEPVAQEEAAAETPAEAPEEKPVTTGRSLFKNV